MDDPVDVVRDALADVPGVAAAFVFGSFARGDFREDRDVDLFVLDDGVDEDLLARRTIGAGIDLCREVSVVQRTADGVARRVTAGSGFMLAVLRGTKLYVAGTEEALNSVVRHTSFATSSVDSPR